MQSQKKYEFQFKKPASYVPQPIGSERLKDGKIKIRKDKNTKGQNYEKKEI